jgi:hypothetical protein
MADGHDAKALVVTQFPSLMRRVEPAQVGTCGWTSSDSQRSAP